MQLLEIGYSHILRADLPVPNPRPSNSPQRLYADSVLFFYDVFGGTILGGVLNPSLATTERNFRVGLDYSSAPTASTGVGKGAKSKKNAVVFNGKGVVADICRFSKGLVVGVEWKNA